MLKISKIGDLIQLKFELEEEKNFFDLIKKNNFENKIKLSEKQTKSLEECVNSEARKQYNLKSDIISITKEIYKFDFKIEENGIYK